MSSDGASRPVRVLVVEDDARAAEAHGAYVGRVPGFELTAVARSGADAVRALEAARTSGGPVDLVLLDLHLPDVHGLALLPRLRAAGHRCDVIAVTSARDVDVVSRAVASGVVLYLLKPFTFASFRAKLEQYLDYLTARAGLSGTAAGAAAVGQDDVDRLLGTLRPSVSALAAAPKGLSGETLRDVVAALRGATVALSASEVAERVGASRVTARRYLEHLADAGQAERRPRYGRGGRPELEYRWR